MNEYDLKRKIDKFLQSMKMQHSSIGYTYWLNAIAYYVLEIKTNGYHIATIREIYEFICNKYDTKLSCVEKAMRYAKETSNYKEVLNIENKLKNREFLVICSNKFVS